MRPVEIALFTDRVAELTQFYARLLGRPPARQSAGMAQFDLGGFTVLVHERSPSAPGQPPCEDHVAFGAADIDAACEELTGQGMTIEMAAADYPWGRSAYLRDPDGRLIEVTQVGAPPRQ